MNMTLSVVTNENIEKRNYWIDKISQLSGDFSIDSNQVEMEIDREIQSAGIDPLLGHLRLCGAIPESYGHDSSEEKLYSKYTDVVIHEAYKAMGFTSLVIRGRADAADVECVTDSFSFVADAKAFRLSRTAKNQKDFKVQAMDNWKHGNTFAMVVCPIYQLPSKTSQIYQQAAARSVCICTYTHLAVLVRYAECTGKPDTIRLVHDLFTSVAAMNPSKNATAYWQAVNRTFLNANDTIRGIWREEKIASIESIELARDEAISFLTAERCRIMRLSKEEAIQEVIKWRKIDNRIEAVRSVNDNRLLEIG